MYSGATLPTKAEEKVGHLPGAVVVDAALAGAVVQLGAFAIEDDEATGRGRECDVRRSIGRGGC